MLSQFALAGSLAVSLGCTKGVPDFEALDTANVPQPIFDNGETTRTIQSRTGTESPTISGTCDKKIKSIVATAVDTDSDAGPLENISLSNSVTCKTDGKFSFTIKTLTGIGWTLVEGKTYEIQLRAVTTAGLSRASVLKVHYSTANGSGANRIIISAGGSMSKPGPRMVSSTNFKAVFSVGNKMPDPATANMQVQSSSGGSFKAKIGAAAAAD